MGVLKDVSKFLDDVGEKLFDEKPFKKKYSSISKQASEGVCHYPVLVSDTINIETLQMISKALERNYASFLMISMSLHPTMKIKNGGDGNVIEYVKQFHQNTTELRHDKYDFLRDLHESFDNYEVFEMFNGDGFIVANTYSQAATESMKKQLVFENNGGYLAGIETGILNDKGVKKIFENTSSKIDDRIEVEDEEELEEEFIPAFEMPVNAFTKPSMQVLFEANGGNGGKGKDKDKDKKDKKKNRDSRPGEEIFAEHMLKDNDVKKANELVPTTLHVKVGLVNDDNRLVKTVDFMLGVKAHMHLVKSQEMITNIVYASKKKGQLFKFIQWTTGEISFFKDFLFDIDSVRHDVSMDANGADWHWSALKRRKAFSKGLGAAMNKNHIMPNTTLVISKEEVDYIYTKFGIDLMNTTVAYKIINDYFLLGLVVVDNATQIAHFLFEGNAGYDSVTFSSLERENSNDAEKFKEMLKVINRN